MDQHINHSRIIERRRYDSLQRVVDFNYYKSFAVFGGDRFARNRVGFYEIAGVCGKMGVVLLHNDPLIEEVLQQITPMIPDLHNSGIPFNLVVTNNANPFDTANFNYDPLYGLEESGVLDVLAPMPFNAPNSLEIQHLRLVLSEYLRIIRYHFQQNPAPFGDYPFNLDLLLKLTQMPYPNFKRSVLDLLPEDIKNASTHILSAEGAQQKAYSAIRTFAQTMGSFLWRESPTGTHTRKSIISAVRQRNLISVYVPEARPDVMEYLATELHQLNYYHIPYLLVESGLNLNNCQRLKNLFLNEHEALNYFTGILAENTSGIVSPESANSDLASLFSQTNEIFIFQLSSTYDAKPFSDGIGNYFRLITEQHRDLHYQPFHFIPGYAQGKVSRETLQQTVTPEELTRLSDGCLIFGKDYSFPLLIESFQI